MPLSSIVTVVLRLFSLLWLVPGLVAFAGNLAAYKSSGGANLLVFVPSLPYFLMAGVAWFFSSALSRLITPRPDPLLNIGGLTRYDLYCFAFVFLGLYFVLSSVGSAISWVYYYIFRAMPNPVGDSSNPLRYQLTQPLITLLAGIFCIVRASQLAQKLSSTQIKREAISLKRPITPTGDLY